LRLGVCGGCIVCVVWCGVVFAQFCVVILWGGFCVW